MPLSGIKVIEVESLNLAAYRLSRNHGRTGADVIAKIERP
jgi:hypothetical protein